MQLEQECTIPATTEKVAVKLKASNGENVSVLLQDDGSKGINPCYINGIKGKLSRIDNQYYFTREKAGTEKTVLSGTDIVTEGMLNHREDIAVIWIGQNGGFGGTEAGLSNIIDRMINYLSYSNRKYVVIGFAHDAYYDSYLSGKYGDKFLPLHDYLVNHALIDAGITPTEADEENIKNNKVPASIMWDHVHLNGKGYEIIGNLVYKKMQQLGYCE